MLVIHKKFIYFVSNLEIIFEIYPIIELADKTNKNNNFEYLKKSKFFFEIKLQIFTYLSCNSLKHNDLDVGIGLCIET